VAIASWSRQILGKATPIVGAATLGAIALVGVPESAQADEMCGPGEDWVDTCESGIDWLNSNAYIDIWLDYDPETGEPLPAPISKQLKFSGPTHIFRGDPVDAIIGHPILGDVGEVDGHLDVIETEIFDLHLTGSDGLTLIAGDGMGNLEDDQEHPSLYSPGAIFEQTENSMLADSFFKVFFELQGTALGPLRNMDAAMLTANRGLAGVPPDKFTHGPIINPCPGGPFPIAYCGGPVDLYAAGNDEEFWTDDDIRVGTLHSEVHEISVPEPGTAIASIFGLGAMLGFTKKRLAKQDK